MLFLFFHIIKEIPVSPAIIVLASGFAVITDPPIYEEETGKAASEGYQLLEVSVIAWPEILDCKNICYVEFRYYPS